MADMMEDQPPFKAQLMSFDEPNPVGVAKECWVYAHKLIDKVENNQSENPEFDLRTALEKLLKVFWVLREHRIGIAQQMHDIGKYLSENFQCAFKFKEDHYYTDCPNLLLHQDYGFSLRGFEKYSCSICNKDPIDCNHRTGKKYDRIECMAFGENCNICMNKIDLCEHSIGDFYDGVIAVKVVSDLEIITFDLVKEPEFVFSRVLEIPYSKKHIFDGLANDPNANEFVYGESVLDCHHCGSCKGYDPNASESLFSNSEYNK